MWYEYLYRVLSILNYVVLLAIGIPLLLQLFYIFCFFLKAKHYPKSEKKARIAYLYPAHNEASVIGDSVRELLSKQNYPKDLYKAIVVAHNCDDDTARLAKEAGAEVIVFNDPDPTHRKALYPLRKGIEAILSKEYGEFDMVIHLDADNHLNEDFSNAMNDAYQAGIDLARPYEGASNGMQNFFTKACAVFYVMESRYGSRVRERMNLGAHVNGSGAMMSVRMLEKTGGYDCVGTSDDTEYFFNRLLDGYHGRYVEDAIVYEDMPSSFEDTYKRNQRIGNGNAELLKTKLPKILGRFFKTGDMTCLEVFLTYILLALTVPLSIWLPLYYVYHFIYLGLAAYEVIPVSLYDLSFYQAQLWNSLYAIIGVVLGLFFVFGYFQAFILAMSEYKKLGAKKRSEFISVVLLFPFFLLLYSVTISRGMLKKSKGWGSAKRNAK